MYLARSGKAGMRWYHRNYQSYKTKPTRSGRIGEEHGEAKRGPLRYAGRFIVNDFLMGWDTLKENVKHPIKSGIKKGIVGNIKYALDRNMEAINTVGNGKTLIKGLNKYIDDLGLREKSYRDYVINYNKTRDIHKNDRMRYARAWGTPLIQNI